MPQSSRLENMIVAFRATPSTTTRMAEHIAIIRWKRTGEPSEFFKGRYSREHTWTFDGGATIPASPSPHVVRPPFSNPAHVDPEEAFVAAISSCHFLTYIWLAGKEGFQIDAYEDRAVGKMTNNERGVPWVSEVTLNPNITYAGDKKPSHADEARLHHAAHEQCFIANSVKTKILVAGFEH
jgi:organic hydroperoxide reductase OsmC/OhrA